LEIAVTNQNYLHKGIKRNWSCENDFCCSVQNLLTFFLKLWKWRGTKL
jgi:hypothetical protein